MKLIRKKNYLILIASISILFISCQDYRIENATSDISRNWLLIKYELNNGDSTIWYSTMITNHTLSFTAEGTYTESYNYFGTPVSAGGFYNFQDNATQLVLSDEDTTFVFKIVDLTPHKLTIELINSYDDDVFYYEPY